MCNKRKRFQVYFCLFSSTQTRFRHQYTIHEGKENRSYPICCVLKLDRDFDIRTRLEAAKSCKWFFVLLFSRIFFSLLLLFTIFLDVICVFFSTQPTRLSFDDRCFRACADNNQLLNYIYMDHFHCQIGISLVIFSTCGYQISPSSFSLCNVCFLFRVQENCHRINQNRHENW